MRKETIWIPTQGKVWVLALNPICGGPPRRSAPTPSSHELVSQGRGQNAKDLPSQPSCSRKQPYDPVLATKREGWFSQVAFGKCLPIWMWSGKIPRLLLRQSLPTMRWQAWGQGACWQWNEGSWALGDTTELFHQPLNCLRPDFLMRWDN